MDIARPATTSACVGFFVATGLLLASCGANASSAQTDRTQVVQVYAASSLTDVFTEFEHRFEASHPGIDIRLNLAGSSTLVRQINDGAPADVFAPADVAILSKLDPSRGHGSDDPPEPYATNELVLVVPEGNPKSIASLADLSSSDILTAKCISGVPCGDATDHGLSAADVELGLATEETNVRSVLAKVVAAEVDAGFVYRTDAQVAPEVEEVGGFDAPIVQLVVIDLRTAAQADKDTETGSPKENGAASFVSYVRSSEAAMVLSDAGFGTP